MAVPQEEHDRILESVREALTWAGMHLKGSGCAFNVDHVDFLGSRITKGLFTPMESTVQSILNFPAPTTVKEQTLSIGRGIPDGSPTVIGYRVQAKGRMPLIPVAFEEAKTAMAQASALVALDPPRLVYLITDAPKVGWGSIIMTPRELKPPIGNIHQC
ncbi:hypothetical protein Q9L58_002256 [Maublancomyces gigas]|uniref:Reverse transcriptase/retrotransposon-derived protein RNase H-like domain-containing protein n=1 Tax=Discina gigas TaxID=1032678 RepID=A0ABR3GS79_9PEZI